jgi:hypothetical protein
MPQRAARIPIRQRDSRITAAALLHTAMLVVVETRDDTAEDAKGLAALASSTSTIRVAPIVAIPGTSRSVSMVGRTPWSAGDPLVALTSVKYLCPTVILDHFASPDPTPCEKHSPGIAGLSPKPGRPGGRPRTRGSAPPGTRMRVHFATRISTSEALASAAGQGT